LANKVEDIYSSFHYGIGQIWCHENGTVVGNGSDEGVLDNPLLHNHSETMAETMAFSFSTPRGGDHVAGDYVSGNSMRVGIENYSISNGTSMDILGLDGSGTKFTYPLYG
jgi:hypothetical protein